MSTGSKMRGFNRATHLSPRQPVAFSGAYMSPIEQQLVAFNILLPSVLLNSHIYTLWTWLAVRNW